VLIILLLNILFSLVFIFAKFAMTSCPPFFLVGLRGLLGGTLLIGYALFARHITPPKFTKQLWGNLALLAIFNVYLANSFEFWGLQYMTAAKTCFIYNLGPFFFGTFFIFIF
jgi:EamA-like transporter family.